MPHDDDEKKPPVLVAALKDHTKPNASEEAIRQLEREYPLHLYRCGVMAKYTMAKYKALTKEGFTEQQAMQLCVASWF